MPGAAFGLDIGSRYTKLVALDGRGNVFLARSIPTSAEGTGADATSTIEAHSLFQRCLAPRPVTDFQDVKVATAIHSRFVMSMLVTVPPMPRKELPSAALFVAKRTMIPLPGPDAVFQVLCLEKKPGAQPSGDEVLVMKTERQGLEERLDLFQRAGITPELITSSSFALLHVLSNEDRQRESLAILNIGAATLDITVSKRGMPPFFRSIPIGCHDLIADLARARQIPDQEAERLVIESGMPDEPSHHEAKELLPAELATSRQLVQPFLERMVTEIRRSLIFYREESGQRVDTILASGGGVLLPTLFDHLRRNLGGDLRLLDPFQECRGKGLRLPEVAPRAPFYAVAYGLARIVSEPGRAKTTVNFLPLEFKRRKQRSVALLRGMAVALIVGLGALAWWLSAQGRAATLRSAIRTLQAEYQSLRPMLAQQEQLAARKRQVAQQRALVDRLQAGQPDVPALLREVVEAVPDGVTLMELAISPPSATAQGASPPVAMSQPSPGVAGQAGAALGSQGSGSWFLQVKGELLARYEAALALAEQMRERLAPSPRIREIRLTFPELQKLQPKSVGGEVELTQPQTFSFSLTATLK